MCTIIRSSSLIFSNNFFGHYVRSIAFYPKEKSGRTARLYQRKLYFNSYIIDFANCCERSFFLLWVGPCCRLITLPLVLFLVGRVSSSVHVRADISTKDYVCWTCTHRLCTVTYNSYIYAYLNSVQHFKGRPHPLSVHYEIRQQKPESLKTTPLVLGTLPIICQRQS